MAGAQRLGIEDAQAFAGVLEATLADASFEDAEPRWDHSGVLEPDTETTTSPIPSDYYTWVPSEPEALAEDQAESIESGIAEDSDQPIAPPATHSLRSRIRMAEPDSTATFGDRLRAMFEALRRTLFRH